MKIFAGLNTPMKICLNRKKAICRDVLNALEMILNAGLIFPSLIGAKAKIS